MIVIEGTGDDSFRLWVQQLVEGVAAIVEPKALHVVTVDHWFDDKWLGFAGKTLGALGVWQPDLRIPPFHPNRVRGERHFRRAEAGTYEPTSFPPLHREQPSDDNLQRRVRDIAPGTACFWHSGDASAIGRGAVMAYLPSEGEPTGWYVGLQLRDQVWVPTVMAGISTGELQLLREGRAG